ncbi:ABC transporter substrate-binding protein [Pararhodobacter sp. SW119]|uniref:ABC transporter substrate-binding protein n=1 Tax=Pararhodobacter sp. SW119 TaxID=2780075 RepID=UPI001ADFE573|nr:ABC transporter substrate-binding protein [Pararhodobacter sp. SW119]
MTRISTSTERNPSFRWLRAGGLAAALALGIAAPPAEARDVTIVLDPPSAETNRFWETSGDNNLGPAMQTLLGNDPVTGEIDTSTVAHTWEVNEDFTSWTFHLRPEAEFHGDWGPVTTADIVHSYQLHTSNDSILTGLTLLRGAELEVLDDHTLTFHLPEPRPNFLFAHAGRGIMLIYSKAQYEAEGIEGYDAAPAGTGHFRLTERRIGEGVTFEAVEDHWSGETSAVSTLDIRYVAEPATKLAMLLAGEADIVALPRELQSEATEADYAILSSTNAAMQTAFMFGNIYEEGVEGYNPELPWMDIRLREAMNRAIDRDVLMEVLYDGRAEKLVRFMMDPRGEGYAPELAERFDEDYGYDPERARELLGEAGYPEAFADPVIPIISTTLGGNPEFPVLAELLQVFFDEVGLQTEIREMDWGTLGGMSRARTAFVLRPMRNAPIRPSVQGLSIFYSSAGNPINFVETAQMEELATAMNASIDPEERGEIARDAFTYLYELYADIPVASVGYEVAVDPDTIVGWTYPGATAIGLSHWHLIEPVAE